MSVPQNQQGQENYPSSTEYQQAVSGKGYTIPYKAPPPKPPPPKGIFRRVKQYNDLRKRGQASSMAWWGTKTLQGCLFSLIPLLFGLVLTSTYVLMGGSMSGAMVGVLLLVGGLAILLWYVFAPWTSNWIVNVSENGYWVVEDGNGHTAEYLPPGRMIVPFRMNSTVHKYVTFQAVTIRETYDDVLPGTGQRVDLEIKVSMAFNPVEADPRFFARLRTMTQKEQFENVVRNQVRDAVSRYFTRLSPHFWERALQNPKILEEAIIDQLIGLDSMGLFLGPVQPVTVFVRGITISSSAPPPPMNPDLYKRDPFDLTPPPTPSQPQAPTSRAQPASAQGAAQGGGARYDFRARPQQDGRRNDQPASHRDADPAPHQSSEAQPTLRNTPGSSGDGKSQPPINWEATIDATMPHMGGGVHNNGATDQPPPSFVPDAIDLNIEDDDTDVDTLLQRTRDNREERPKADRRAKLSDNTQPRTTRPDFWIRGRDDDGA